MSAGPRVNIPRLTDIETWLDSFLNFERLPKKNIFWLDTMQFLCARFGNPHTAFKSVHVAGSKGKGSVCACIAAILAEAAYSCGVYASPHIVHFAERIRTASGFFPDSVYQAAGRELISGIEAVPPEELPGQREITWFELATLYAFLCFRHAHADWAVCETGLGGRLDATNVLEPAAAVLTPIELEHTQYLGNTIALIAQEKAGIIKERTPVYCAAQVQEARQVFEQTAYRKNAPIFFLDSPGVQIQYDIRADGTHTRIQAPCFSRPLAAVLKLYGGFQAENAALAACTVKGLCPALSEEVIERGLARAWIPGRFEIIAETDSTPELILDGAHTVKSVGCTLETLAALYDNPFDIPVLFACAADKDMEHIAALFKNVSHITLTTPGPYKQSALPRLAQAFASCGVKAYAEADCARAIGQSMKHAKKQHMPLLVVGSFYLLAEVMRYINGSGENID
ncbi:MAG TPA: bifunctional folylpolyglutamate synthase/dihydrofolate synthase [Candidatus Treponema faecavium]|nr:bifunctional folylpolyglutamate synthase/dihydrofolate synthase [Candidatus Treponema faecavium]